MKINFQQAIADALNGTNVDEQVASEIDAILDNVSAANSKAKKANGDSFKPVRHNEAQVDAAVRRVLADSGLSAIVNDAIVAAAIRAAHEHAGL